MALGAGIQYINSNSVDKKPGYTTENEIYNKEYDSGSKWFPGPAMSMNIGYRF
ncbi:MAG: hypothetical protein JW731_15125 [Bacteroidales bacterium]|nr:hypothetical protein [Bacteroidales bacterium]